MAIDYTKEGKIAIFTINRPKAFNSMSMEALRELQDSLIDFRDDDQLMVGIITGAGEKAFCAGADIQETLTFLKEHRESPWAFPATHFRGLELWKPLIAAINGVALGGGLEIAIACDFRIAADNARLGTPEVAVVGLIPGWGGTQRLPRLIPGCKAAEILMLGKPIDAQEAYRIGLVNKVVPQSELMATAKAWAEALCQTGPLALKAAKKAMIQGSSMTLEEGLNLELSLFNHLLGTEDHAEGVAAFTEKRKPNYQGK